MNYCNGKISEIMLKITPRTGGLAYMIAAVQQTFVYIQAHDKTQRYMPFRITQSR